MFYTYLWLREDGTPYYVGKGLLKRALRKGHPEGRVILQEHLCEADAYTAEKFLIEYYGRKDLGMGILRNRTDGGDGVSGAVFSEERRKSIAKWMSERIISEETIIKRSQSLKNKPWSDLRRKSEQKRIKRVPLCHPKRQHKANGMCKPCAYREWALRTGRVDGSRGSRVY